MLPKILAMSYESCRCERKKYGSKKYGVRVQKTSIDIDCNLEEMNLWRERYGLNMKGHGII